MSEGYVKFDCEWIGEAIAIPEDSFLALSVWRARLREQGLVGANLDGVGFGNISIRAGGSRFFITGAATGHLAQLEQRHYALVEECGYAENCLRCRGETKASSESLSHGAVYEALPSVGAVIHVHSSMIWEAGRDRLPTTDPRIEYGTPEMALALMDLVRDPDTEQERTVIMGGHKDGVVCFGEDMERAGAIVLGLLAP